ncbi:MAG: cytochrome c biogenesis protein [Methanosarcinaceae archaeon]|nr:cytochrome c biogenesis protein [Methanosarcinaceae archaeon]MDD4330738.1 cytochrome c biogenesis protein [Methanosarcinaceae archaeon]MDD4749007.1 cytochrome c biogenesis protein [Methanosarcinaceae archaeon]
MSRNFRKIEAFLGLLTAGVMLFAFYLMFFYLPPMKDEAGEVLNSSFNIFYFHLPIALSSYLAFAILFLCSLFFLWKKASCWDIYARSAAEVGALFAFLVLLTGSIWAKAAWGWYWIWDIRLSTSLVLFLVYLAYLALRQAVEEPEKRARFAAVFGILGFVSVPMSFFSIRLWRSAHPLMFGQNLGASGKGGGLEGSALKLTLLVNSLAIFLLFASLFILKTQNESLQEKLEEKNARQFDE